MRAAAHTPGGYGGVSQAVGREFVDADKEHPHRRLPERVKRDSGGAVPDVSVNILGGAGTLENGMSGFGMTGDMPNGAEHSNKALQYPGEAIGAAIGSIWGMPGLGAMAGKNAGLTAGDLAGGNWNGLGWDASSNLPPGMQATGVGGMANAATGLPLHQWFGVKRGGAVKDNTDKMQGAARVAHHLATGGVADISGTGAYGLVQSSIPGRTDRHNVDLPSGSYVLPADVVSGLGEGNSMAGAALWDKILNTGPWGTKLPSGSVRGSSIPHPPSGYQSADGSYQLHNMAANAGLASGGPPKPMHLRHSAHGNHPKVPAVIAGGEFVIPPDMIAHHPLLGDLPANNLDPDDYKRHLKHGHEVLDKWVKMARAEQIKTLKKLPGPVK